MLGFLDQCPAMHQSTGDAHDEGVEQLTQRGGRGWRRAVEVGLVVLESVGAIGYENMEMDVEIER